MDKTIKMIFRVAFLFTLPLLFSSCEDLFGEWERPVPVIPPTPDTPTAFDPVKTPLTLEAVEDGTIKIQFSDSYTLPKPIKYTKNGEVGEDITATTNITVAAGDIVCLYSENAGLSSPTYKYVMIRTDNKCYVYGNVMSLINDEGDFTTDHVIGAPHAFQYLLSYNSKLYNHPEKDLVLPATTLTDRCYSGMFQADTKLTKAPALPATIMKEACYEHMFDECSSLTTAPELPALNLAKYCYSNMFDECTSLTNPPILPAITMAYACYYSMFSKCTSLVTPPYLPANVLAEQCYSEMFSGCTSLTTVPSLPATTLAHGCYFGMFNQCTSLTTLPTNLLPATVMKIGCYEFMFNLCSNLTNVPKLPATTLDQRCYRYMFSCCSSIASVPADLLPATNMVYSCYEGMFEDCTSLTSAPDLPATTLAKYCYHIMFSGCSNLNYVKCLAKNKSEEGCTYLWLKNVASSGSFVRDSGTYWSGGDSGVPSGWIITP